MPKNTGAKSHKQRNDERLFAAAAIFAALVAGTAFCLLLFALNRRENDAVSDPVAPPADSESHLIAPDHPRQLANFALSDCTGRPVTRRDLDGKIVVVDFLFTGCTLTCPAVSGQMAQIQQLTTNQPDVKLVSLTVDPRDDTPAVLEKYGERFGADASRWLFLTGDKGELYRLIGTSFLAPDTNNQFGFMAGNFAHTERIALVDSQGRLCGYFDGLNLNTAVVVVREIAKLRNQTLQKP
jgi:protein SCO1/2